MNYNISLINDEAELKKNIEDVLLDLPEWFGIPESTQEYIDKGSKLPTFVADIDNEPIGFISLKILNDDEIELYVLGVKRKYHRMGVGKKLINETISYCKANDIKRIIVMTLDESYEPFDANYDNTRKFYEAVGFTKIKVDSEIWGSTCPCLILKLEIKPIN